MSENDTVQQFQSALLKVAGALNAALPGIGDKAAEYFGDLVTANIVQTSAMLPPDHRPGIAGVLQSSGVLARSLSLGAGADNANMQYTLDFNEGKLSITFGSNLPYAAIQQYGGAITPTEKMRRFMLAMVIQTQGKDDFWVKMLGHVIHGAPIIIKPANYLDDPMQRFVESAPEIVQTLLLSAIMKTKN